MDGDRVIDAERAGGTGNAVPKRIATTPPLTVDEAMSYRDGIAWRHFKPRSDRVVVALADELMRIRAALSDVICCACGEGAACTRDPYGWGVCCAMRGRMVRAGLLPQPQRQPDQEDGL